MTEKISKTDEEDLAFECRILAGRGEYKKIIETLQSTPEVINYLTVGELKRYIKSYITISPDKLTGHNLKRLKHNIENIIFGDKK